MFKDRAQDAELDYFSRLDFERRRHDTAGARVLTCHTPGTFFRFASIISAAKILLFLPGPVKVDMRRFRIFTCKAAVAKTRIVVKAMDLMGKVVADAIL